MKTIKFKGYASVFGIKDLQSHTIMPGAFAESIQKRQPKMHWEHKYPVQIGEWTKIAENKLGLYVEGYLYPSDANSNQQKVCEMLNTKLSGLKKIGLSIGISNLNGKPKNLDVKSITQVDLIEISLTQKPANSKAMAYII